jgi:hypothetical protein
MTRNLPGGSAGADAVAAAVIVAAAVAASFVWGAGASRASGDPGPRVAVARPIMGTGHDFGLSIVPFGGDFVVAGLSATTTRDMPLLLRLNAGGSEVWTQRMTELDGALFCVRVMEDSTLVAVGWSGRDSTDLDAFAARFDRDGRRLWQRVYRGPRKERLWSFDVTPDGFVAAGEAMNADASASEAFVLHLDRDGNEVRRSFHGGKPVERVFSVQALADGGYVLAGLSGSGPRESAGYGARITRYDAGDKLKWSRDWGGKGFDVAHDIEKLVDGSLIVTGYTFADSVRKSDAFLLKVSAGGDVQWARTYGDERDDRATHVALLPDGGFAIVGYSRDVGAGGAASGQPDMTLRATDARGELRWERDFGGSGPELGRCVVATADGGLAAVGQTGSYGALERVYFVRLEGVSAPKMARAQQ